MSFINVFHFTLLHFNSIKLGLLYFTSLQLLILKAVFEEPVYFKCIFEFRRTPARTYSYRVVGRLQRGYTEG